MSNKLKEFNFEKIDSFEIKDLINKPSKEITDLASKIEENTKNSLLNYSEQQLKFYNDCSQLIFGDLKENTPILIPAKCGFGKTTFLKSMINTLINEIKEKRLAEDFLPMIIVQERLEDIKAFCKEVNKLGRYNNKYPYVFVIEGWNDKFKCKNKFPPETIKESYTKCNSTNCDVFNTCKLKTQYINAKKSPILAITTARLSYITDNNELNKYAKFQNKNDIVILRNKLIIDEKPKFIRNETINSKLVRELKEFVEEYNNENSKRKNFDIKIENYFLKELNTIENYINDIREKYKNFQNLVVKFDKDIIKEEFINKWNKYIKKKNPKFELLLEIFKNPLLWSKYLNTSNFHLIAHNNFNTDSLNTFIFDGTAEITLEYKSEFNNFKYLKIDHYKDYSHLNFHVIEENLSRNSIKNNIEKLELACKWINKKFKDKTYVVSYKKYRDKITELITNNNIIKVKEGEKKVIPHFGNTKGKNEWGNCKKMVQLGWNRFNNGDYISQFLALNPKWTNMLQKAYEIYEVSENPSNDLIDIITPDNKGNFHKKELQKYMLMKTVIDLEQEVYRTHVRKFTSLEEVNIYLFIKAQNYKEIKDLISIRFKNCKFIKDNGFKEFQIFEKHQNIKNLFKELDSKWSTEKKEVALLKKKYQINKKGEWNRYFSLNSDLKSNYKFLLDMRNIECIKENNRLYLIKTEGTDSNIN